MIITYSSCNDKYDTFLYIPDTMPWKLTAKLHRLTENDNMEDDLVEYVLQLVTGAGMEEDLMRSEEFWGSVPEELDEDDWILELFNEVVYWGSSYLAMALREGKTVFDLGSVITSCMEEWKDEMKRAIARGDKHEK